MTVLDRLTASLAAGKVLTDEATLHSRRHDYWFLSALNEYQGRLAPNPLCVVRPTSIDDVVATVNACREAGVALITFGLGSGVCGGVIASPESVLLDMSSMNRVREIDTVNMLGSFDAGHNGAAAEQLVAAKGMTMGNFPQSIALSTVGGWIATRASGQFSSVYGNVEDMIYGVEAVMPDGAVVNFGKAPRASAGPDLRHLLLGSDAVLAATAENGGGIAHHHGIGRVRRKHLAAELGDTGVAVLRAVKSALDPEGIMNPGVLLPDA